MAVVNGRVTSPSIDIAFISAAMKVERKRPTSETKQPSNCSAKLPSSTSSTRTTTPPTTYEPHPHPLHHLPRLPDHRHPPRPRHHRRRRGHRLPALLRGDRLRPVA